LKNTGLQVRIMIRFYNLRSLFFGWLYTNQPFFAVPIFLYLVIPSVVTGRDSEWSVLSSDDTLAVYITDTRVGMLYSKMKVDNAKKTIASTQNTGISADAVAAGNFGGMEIGETRVYDFSGNLVSAIQSLRSQSGVATWKLEKNEKGKWQHTVIAGGMTNTRLVEGIVDNLKTDYAIMQGVREKKLSVGQEWTDTLFELTAVKNMVFTIECIAVPDTNNHHYAFRSHNDMTGFDIRHEIDTGGRMVLQEVPPIFIAKRISADDREEKGEAKKKTDVDYLYELINIPMDRAQKRSETIALTLKPGTKIHESVMRFYDYRDNKYVIKNLNEKCHTKNLSVKKEELNGWLSSTVTVQSDNKEIQELAMNLKGTRTCRCEISKTYSDYLYRNIEKKHVATFSNAYETLKAGYGDCGEHAVLLCALLRSVGIESNVVLGMVYSDIKKSYYYHAWVVAFVKDLVFFDPALGVDPATGGYIPLILDDDGTKMVYLAGMVGKISINYLPNK